MWQNWINLILGIWVIISAYLGFTAPQLQTDLTITGIIIAGLALWSALQTQDTTTYRPRRE